MPNDLRMRSLLAIALMSVLVCGCGSGVKSRPPMAKVKGVVKYKGNPVANAMVNFSTEGAPRMASGMTDDQGRFQLTTYETNDGAPVGTHKVTVTRIEATAGPAKMSAMDLASKGPPPPPKGGVIPMKYADLKTTPLVSTVDAGSNDKTLELED